MITQYSNFAFGDMPVSKLYQGETLVWPLDNMPKGPGPDVLLSWISNGSDALQPNVYFDTQFIPNSTTNVEIKYSFHSRVNDSGLFGSQNYELTFGNEPYPIQGSKINAYNMMLSGPVFNWSSKSYSTVVNYNEVGHYYNSSSDSHVLTNGVNLGNVSLDTPHTVIITQKETNVSSYAGCTVKSDSSMNWKVTTRVGYPFVSMYLFAINVYNQGAKYFASADTRIYYVKIYDKYMMYRFLIPVLHYDSSLNDYVPCFYDKVSNTYFYNLGTDNVKYLIQGDFLLDYIERDDSGYLTYMTGEDVSLGLLTNLGFTVGDASTSMESMTQNLVIGAALNQGGPITDTNTGFGYMHPGSSNTTTTAYVGLGQIITAGYDYPLHVRNNHHADNLSFVTYAQYKNSSTSYVKEYNSNLTSLEFREGVLPSSNDIRVNKTVTNHTYSSSLPTVGHEIGLFGDNNMHAFETTKIFYADLSNYSMYPSPNNDANWPCKEPHHSYIPVLHEGIPCYYDFITRTRIYNTGEGIPAYEVLGYPIGYTPPDIPDDPPVIPDPPAGTYVLEPVDLGLSVKWASCNLGAATPTDQGYLYPWGYIEQASNDPTWDEYKWYDSSTKTMTKYVWSEQPLNIEDDAAYVVNQNWHIPTPEDFKELKENTTQTIEVVNGVTVMKCRSKKYGYTSKYIYLPAPVTNPYQINSHYWTNSLVTQYGNYSYEQQRMWAAALIMQIRYDYDIIYYDKVTPYWPDVQWAINKVNTGHDGHMPRTCRGFIRPVCTS